MMKAVILAGGKGVRLGDLTKKIPKPMIKIGGMPILEHQIRLLRRYNIKDIIILTGHLSKVIEKYFKDGSNPGVKISYFSENEPLGTTGGIKEIENKLREDFIVFYGDVMVNMNLERLVKFHKRKNALGTLVIHPNDHPNDSDLVEIDKNKRITAFHPKPHQANKYFSNLVNAGVYLLSPGIFKYIKRGEKADFGKDIFPGLTGGKKIYGYNTAEYLKDAGTPERLKEVKKDYSSGKIERFNNEEKRKAIFLDRDGVINEEVDLLHKIKDFRFLPGTGKAIKKINDSEFLAVVVTNQPVVARGLCTIEGLENIHKKMETLLGGEKAKLDSIYYCPHHPDKGHPGENPAFKIKCSCRKPEIGMVKEAEKDFNIDLKHSFFIGDSFRDILCAKKAGVTPIALRSGKGGKNIEIKPDYFFENLPEAVDFIIDEPYKKYFEKIKTKVLKSKSKKPFIIIIGGNTRSGKTILANYLAQKFRELKKKALIINLDNWLLPKEKRRKEHNVYDRFQMERINDDLEKFFKKREIAINRYDALSRGTSGSKIRYKMGSAAIIIIKGVIALGAKNLREKADLKIFCEIDSGLLAKRISSFYKWKGLNKNEINRLIETRKKDEYNLVKKEKRFADMIIKRGKGK